MLTGFLLDPLCVAEDVPRPVWTGAGELMCSLCSAVAPELLCCHSGSCPHPDESFCSSCIKTSLGSTAYCPCCAEASPQKARGREPKKKRAPPPKKTSKKVEVDSCIMELLGGDGRSSARAVVTWFENPANHPDGKPYCGARPSKATMQLVLTTKECSPGVAAAVMGG